MREIFALIQHLSFLSIYSSYSYNSDNFLTEVSFNKEVTRYEYDNVQGVLIKVIKPDKSSTKYLYGNNGHYIGFESYDPEGNFLHGISYQSISPGQYMTVENPGNIISKIRFNSKSEIVSMQPRGSLPLIVKKTAKGKEIYLDDSVSVLLQSFPISICFNTIL